MTISSTSRTAGPFAGNGVTVAFPFSYKVFDRSDVLVARTVTATGVEAILVLDSDYTVTLNADQNSSPGGIISLTAPLAAGTTLAATSNLTIQQSLDLTNGGGFYPTAINNALDRIVINIQQLAARVGAGALNVGSSANIAGILNALTNLAAAAGSSLVGFIQAGSGAVLRSVQDELRQRPSVFQFMTAAQIADVKAGTALLDVTAACQAALTAHKHVEFPHPGKYKLTAPLIPQNGATIKGGGKSPVYPYDIGTYNGSFGTELLVTNFAAFILDGLTGVKINGFGFKATAGGVSAYGTAAHYVAGAIGVDLTGSTMCEVRDVSFHGLEYGWAISHTTNGASTFFPTLYDYTAQDCKAVVKIGNATSVNTRVQDPAIAACAIALHCNQMIDVNWGDGLRVNDCRFFQAYGKSIQIKNTPFVTMTGVTAFESSDDNITIESCKKVAMAGVTSSRAGGYIGTTPWPSHRGISLINSTDIVVHAVIENPSESGLYISGCSNVKGDVAIVAPFNTNGMLSAGAVLGAVTVVASSNVNVDIAASGTGYLYALACDHASSLTLVGKVGSETYAGVYRGFDLANPAFAMVAELAADTLIGTLGSSVVATKRIFVPAGKSIVSRAFHMTSPGVTLRIGGAFWTAGLTVEADGGNTSFEKKVIYTNAGADAYYQVAVQLYNPTGAGVTVPAGHKTMVSFAVE